MSQLQVEILAFAGCPNVEQARVNVQQAIDDEGVAASVAYLEIASPEMALSHRFLGSPSVRINGSDVEAGADDRLNFGLMCRTYAQGGAVMGATSVEMIRAALHR